ncbi:MAG: hypothetical protein CMJ83_20170 [Planctomycetes bacterium]|nr:hypothetical protein [Planctomycetota bacterium]
MPFQSQAILIDAGQTLLDPTVPVMEAYLREARAVGAAPDPESFRSHMTACWQHLRENPSADLGASDAGEAAQWHRFTVDVAAPFEDLASRHTAWLEQLVSWFDSTDAWQVADGGIELLDRLRADGRPVGIVSNWHSALEGVLDRLELTPKLDFVLISAVFGRKKPDPSIFTEALRLAGGVAAHEALHIGDSIRDDVEGALNAGIRPILIARDAPASLPERVRCVSGLDALL